MLGYCLGTVLVTVLFGVSLKNYADVLDVIVS